MSSDLSQVRIELNIASVEHQLHFTFILQILKSAVPITQSDRRLDHNANGLCPLWSLYDSMVTWEKELKVSANITTIWSTTNWSFAIERKSICHLCKTFQIVCNCNQGVTGSFRQQLLMMTSSAKRRTRARPERRQSSRPEEDLCLKVWWYKNCKQTTEKRIVRKQ